MTSVIRSFSRCATFGAPVNCVPRPGKYLPALAQDPTVLDRMRRFIFPNRFLI